MLMRSLAAAAVFAVVGGCAGVQTGADDEAAVDGKEVYCQTDDGTGSRLAPRTSCNNGVNTDDQKAVRSMQNK